MKSLKIKNLISAICISLVLFNSISYACDLHGKTGFLPENKMNIPVGLKSLGGVNEAQFNRIMDKMMNLYSSTVSKLGSKLNIERRWTDGTVNAYADEKTPGVFNIAMFGGLARHPEVTEDGMVLVVCHELGHHLGGAPKKTDPETGSPYWASNEGQADYWGAMKCLSNYFEADDNVTIIKSLTVPATVTKNCQLIYKNNNEVAICQRSAMAGLSVGKLFNDLSKDKLSVDFTTPDTSTVQVTFDKHPHSQCRLDTYFQASLCDHGFSEVVSNTDANISVCSLKNGDVVGNRPTCWYKAE